METLNTRVYRSPSIYYGYKAAPRERGRVDITASGIKRRIIFSADAKEIAMVNINLEDM